ncbi:MAG: transferase [Candidatus Levybacteria bacterium]|nr:transferase [Candidatus Levybacteria bacterium]
MSRKIFKNVILGKNCIIEDCSEIGHPPKGEKDGQLKTVIGDNAVIRSGTVIYAGVTIGDNFQTGHNVLIREDNKVGNNVSIGTNSTIEVENRIGNNVRIHSLCFLEKAVIADYVFIGPGVICTDNPHPNINSSVKDQCVKGPIIKKSVKIGAGVTILPNIVIGENALIGAGSVVTKNVNPNTVMVGNPARATKKVRDVICLKKTKPHRPYGE